MNQTTTTGDIVPDIITSPEGLRNHIEGRRLLREQYERDRKVMLSRLYRESAEARVQAAQKDVQKDVQK